MIKLIEVKKQFGTKWISQGINLEIPTGAMTAIIGRSGEGKSVLLKQIIGLIQPTSGHIIVDGIDSTQLSHHAREEHFKKFGYVFQFAALLDSLTIFENIGITLLEKGHHPEEVVPIVKEKLTLVHLPLDVLYKYPSELSGGMKKRVGLARTLITQPRYMLYDEPTTGLDPITTRIIHQLMLDVQQQHNFTSIVVSHDIEIFNYVDYIALLHEGKIRYFGQAKTIWDTDNPYVHQFIRGNTQGPMNHELRYA